MEQFTFETQDGYKTVKKDEIDCYRASLNGCAIYIKGKDTPIYVKESFELVDSMFGI